MCPTRVPRMSKMYFAGLLIYSLRLPPLVGKFKLPTSPRLFYPTTVSKYNLPASPGLRIMIAIQKKWANRNGASCGSLSTPRSQESNTYQYPRTDRVKILQSFPVLREMYLCYEKITWCNDVCYSWLKVLRILLFIEVFIYEKLRLSCLWN